MVSKIALFLLHLLGWELIGQRPPYKKYVLVGAPHTSNWDFLYFYLGALAMGLRVSFMAKDSIFRGPLGPILRWMGGIPVVRSRRTNMVEQMVRAFGERESLILLVPPSGTRRRTDYWKSGFYFIALGAQVPLVLAIMDFEQREVGIVHSFMPIGDIKADMEIIRQVYEPVTAKFPSEKSQIRLRQEDEPAPQARVNDAAITGWDWGEAGAGRGGEGVHEQAPMA
jgi:1-acyl-sn-glycerol-3-phosphate acyltransferase